MPERVVTTEGALVFDSQQIKDGQNVWHSMGGQEGGSIWGDSAYVDPDWSADWLHREAEWILDEWSLREYGQPFEELEVVSLVLIGLEAYENLTLARVRPWVSQYKWPIYFFVAVAFWNLVRAGLFGFLINPPIALYYMQGLNTTPVHSHAALFGVYGMLGIGLMLFCLKGMATQHPWKTRLLSVSFWSTNIGLA